MTDSTLFSQRSILTFMALAGIVNAHLMRLCVNGVNLARREMSSNTTMRSLFTKSTMMDIELIVLDQSKKFHWSRETDSLIKSAFFIGYGLFHIPASYLAHKYGGKMILNFGLFLTALCTLLTPIALLNNDADGLITLRFFMGIGEAPAYPALIYLLSGWIPRNERGRVCSMVFGGGQIAFIIYNLVTGCTFPYCEESTKLFYIFGTVGILWNIAFQFLVYDRPSTHPRITVEEKRFLENEIGYLVKTESFFQIPWISMLTSPAVWVLIVAQLGHDWAFYVLASEMPNYFLNVLKFDCQQLAIFTSIPFFVSCSFSLLYGTVCDSIVRRNLVTLTHARQIFTTISAVGSACFTILIYVAEFDRILAVISLTLAMGSMSAFYAGAEANFLDLCPNYSGALIGLVSGTGAACGFLVPHLTGLLTTDGKYWEWEPVFWTSAIVLSTSLATYVVWGSAEIQPWNNTIVEDNFVKRAYRYLRQRLE